MDHAFINGKRIYAFKSKEEFLEYLTERTGILVALNAEKLNKSNAELDRIINRNIGYPDGIGAVWALRRKGFQSTKIAGAEFWLDIIRHYGNNRSFYLIGATDEVIDQTIKKLKTEFPSIRVAGYRNGFLKEGDRHLLIQDFKATQPDVIFVAMGSPKQEFLMADFLVEFPALYMGLGGSYDVYSGFKKRAPKIFIKLGLEWFYRLFKEPTRFSRQTNLLKFLFRIIFDKL
ncbi:MAG: WecB/TagA/CpsF family glycosyltransferase [Flavobacteriaceae bacterium]|nr:WecB/TagA/CpsF family glycosyltransferase [Flavobacteriaceae bacterium]MDH3795882.1 WecB/TagA/CpsF family glycosyltransferase [Flavobacteriaceae bacterium]